MSSTRLRWLGLCILALASVATAVRPDGTTAHDAPEISNVQVNVAANVPFPQNGQNQPAPAQNPLNPKNLIASSNDEIAPNGQGTGFYASFDGGLTWPCQGTLDLSKFKKIAFGDAWQTFDSEGNAYLSTIALPLPKQGKPVRFDTADIFVGISTDGGCTYPKITKVASNSQNVSDDKPSIAADKNPRSRYADNLYVAWTQFDNAAQGVDEHTQIQIVLSRSTNGGKSWSKPVGLSEETTIIFPGLPPRQGANVQVGPDGTVYVAWADTIDFQFKQLLAVSKDGGKSFSDPVVVATIADDFSPPGGASFRQLGRVLPSLSVSSEGALHMAWAERSLGHTVGVLTSSTNGGETWTPPAPVADVDGRSVFFATVASGPHDAVYVAFLAMDDVADDTAPGAGVVSYDAYAVHSSDGGATFGAPVKLSTESSDPNVSSAHSLVVQFLGDYIMAVADKDHLYVAWTDTRNGSSCAAVDEFRLGGPPPAGIEDCPIDFGDADIFLGIVPTH